MKLKMKALAAAVALTVAGSANAAIDDFASGDGELFFSVRDNEQNVICFGLEYQIEPIQWKRKFDVQRHGQLRCRFFR